MNFLSEGALKSRASKEELLHVVRGTISCGIEIWLQPPIVFYCSQRTVVCVGINRLEPRLGDRV